MGDTLLSNCRVQAPGKLLWLRAVCRWEPERARAKPRWETSFSRWQPPAATGDQGISEQWVIKWSYSPDSEEILRTQILVVRSASEWVRTEKNAPVIREQEVCEAQCEARPDAGEAGEAEEGRGQHPASRQADQARAPLSRETPGRNGPVHSASGEWDFPLFTINLLLFVLSSPPAWAIWMCFHVMLYSASETVRDPSMLDMTDIVTWLVTWHSIMSYSTVSNVTPIKFKYRCVIRSNFGIYFLWLETTELMSLMCCLTFKYFPKVSKNKMSWHFHRKFTKFMVSSVAGRLTWLRAPGSRFCSSRHFGDRLLWASVHGREERHKMDRPGQVHQEADLQTARYLQSDNLLWSCSKSW